jgi:TatD family-associated radical SAM protein
MTGSRTQPRGAIAYRGPRDSIYLNLTNRCSAACWFCVRDWSHGVYGADLVLESEPELDDVTAAVEREYLKGPAPEVVFCGFGEPTMRLDLVLGVTEWLRVRRITSRLDTNGHGSLVNPGVDVPAALAAAGLGSVSVSLNAADPATYENLCRPVFHKAYRAVIKFTEECIRHDIETTVTAVDHPDVDLEECEALARRLGAQFRVRALVSRPEGG